MSSKRYNRFGSNRATAKTTSTTSSTTSAPSSERPSFGRKPPNPRRPVFISREVNEPVSVVSKRPFSFNNSGRLKLPLRPTSSTTSTTEGLEVEDSNEQYEQESHEEEEQEEEQPVQQQLLEQQLDHQLEQKQVEPASLEKLPLQEETSSPIAISQESSSPEYSTSSTEESQTDASDSSDFTEETTLSNPSHEYEYVEDHDDKATTTAIPAFKDEKDSTEEQERQTELESETTELPSESTSTTSNTPDDAAENNQQTTAEASEESSKSSTSKQEEESEYDDEEGEEGKKIHFDIHIFLTTVLNVNPFQVTRNTSTTRRRNSRMELVTMKDTKTRTAILTSLPSRSHCRRQRIVAKQKSSTRMNEKSSQW